MTTKDFIQILQQPQTVSQEQTNALSGIIEEFPYFQSARAVYLKGLKNKVNRIWVVGNGTKLNYKITNKAYWSEVPGLLYMIFQMRLKTLM